MNVDVPDSDSCEFPRAEPEVQIGSVFAVPADEVVTVPGFPALPLEAAVMIPDEETVRLVFVYVPEATPEFVSATVVVEFPPDVARVVVTFPVPMTL